MSKMQRIGPLTFASEGRVFVNAWTSAATGRDIDNVRRAQLAAHRANGTLGVITILQARSIPRFDEEMRRASAEARRALEPTYVCSAFVIEEDGFVAAAFRSFLSGVHAVSRASYPTKVFRDVYVASQWTAEHLAAAGAVIDAERITAIVQRVRLTSDEDPDGGSATRDGRADRRTRGD